MPRGMRSAASLVGRTRRLRMATPPRVFEPAASLRRPPGMRRHLPPNQPSPTPGCLLPDLICAYPGGNSSRDELAATAPLAHHHRARGGEHEPLARVEREDSIFQAARVDGLFQLAPGSAVI